jgi:hypothetical protein
MYGDVMTEPAQGGQEPRIVVAALALSTILLLKARRIPKGA